MNLSEIVKKSYAIEDAMMRLLTVSDALDCIGLHRVSSAIQDAQYVVASLTKEIRSATDAELEANLHAARESSGTLLKAILSGAIVNPDHPRVSSTPPDEELP